MTQRRSLQSSYNYEFQNILSKRVFVFEINSHQSKGWQTVSFFFCLLRSFTIRLKQFYFPKLFIVGSNVPLMDQMTEMLDPVRVIRWSAQPVCSTECFITTYPMNQTCDFYEDSLGRLQSPAMELYPEQRDLLYPKMCIIKRCLKHPVHQKLHGAEK